MLIYTYNGFDKPKLIDLENAQVVSNYLGDITDEVLDYYKDIKTWALDDIIENQPLASYGLWINPTLQQLQQFNKNVMLNENDYLQDFKNNTKENNKMEKYNYEEVMTKDIKQAIKEYMEWKNVSIENLNIDTLNDYLWTDDSVTGNASGSYTMNSALAKKYVLDNEELQVEVIKEFGLDSEDIADKLHDWEYWDVSIRCYLLYEVLQGVLEDLEDMEV